MKAERLEELRKEAEGSCYCYDCIEFGPNPECPWQASRIELVKAVDLFRAANAQTNDARNADRKRLSEVIANQTAEIIQLKQDTDPELYRLQNALNDMRARNGRLHGEITKLHRANTELSNDLARFKAEAYKNGQLACAAAFEHGRTLEELEHYKAQLAGVIKAWDEEREDRRYDHHGEDV